MGIVAECIKGCGTKPEIGPGNFCNISFPYKTNIFVIPFANLNMNGPNTTLPRERQHQLWLEREARAQEEFRVRREREEMKKRGEL